MTWKKGQSGNPGGKTEKVFAEQFRIIGLEVDPKTKVTKARMLCESVYKLALLKKPEPWAVQLIMDRVDGKPAQESSVTIRNEHDRTDWTWESLVAFIDDSRKSGNGAKGEVEGEPGSDSVH